MADYDDPININDYKYKKPVYYTNPFSIYKTNLIVKLILNENNFNFNLANDDGSDFRLMEYKNGTGVLKMWVAYWSKENKHAVLFFKVPDIGGGSSVIFTAYWGNPNALDISDPESLGFLFYEDFSGTSLSSDKWSGYLTNGFTEYGYYFSSTNHSFSTTTNPLENYNNWILEAGVYANFASTGWHASRWSIGFEFTGTENGFTIGILHVDSIIQNAVEPAQATSTQITKICGGLEPYSYQEVYIDYYEPEDRVTLKLQNRNTYDDVIYEIQRKVEGDTRLQNITLHGYQISVSTAGANPVYISWLAVREYDGISLSSLDGRDLYIPYASVLHQAQDYKSYSSDFTNVAYAHESSFGGDPYKLSDEGYDADSNVWISDEGASLEDEVYLTIHTAWTQDVTDRGYIHYDSGHIYYYNASKLSDNDTDRMARNFWHCTTTSGWAAIKFPSIKNIGAFRIKATSNLDACPKNFIFYGSNFNPQFYFDRAEKLIDGIFEQTTEWQARVIINATKYKYYILFIQDTYGSQNVEIQEWEMMASLGQIEKKYPSQLRLHPALYSNWEYNFPLEISLQGSVDNVNWITLLPWTYTYTPFIQHYNDYGYWQRYSFTNDFGYWSFRLLCKGNWGASDNRIIIGEWSLHELEEEEYTYRILGGTTNNIQQIWASNFCKIDDEHSIIFIANEKMNKVSSRKLIGTEDLPDYYEDFNVI